MKSLLMDLEIFINFFNWAVPAITIAILPIAIIYFIVKIAYLKYKKSREEVYVELKKCKYFFLFYIAIFVLYGFVQFVGALFGVDTNKRVAVDSTNYHNANSNKIYGK